MGDGGEPVNVERATPRDTHETEAHAAGSHVCACSRRAFLERSVKHVIGAALAAGLIPSCNTVPNGVVGDDEHKLKTIDITDIYYDELTVVGGAANVWLNDDVTGELLPLIGYRLSQTEVIVVSAICPHEHFVMRVENVAEGGVLTCTNHLSSFDLHDNGATMGNSMSPVPLVVYPSILQGSLLTIFEPHA
jgi:nitrite reductase/ring-hydroxylating ferredoxin subunit